MSFLPDSVRQAIHKTTDGNRLAPHAGDFMWYVCQHPWPDDCFVQCGDENTSQSKAFFEVSPKDSMYIRGDADTLIKAETKAWNIFEAQNKCELDHGDPNSFDKKGYRNGLGFCKACNHLKMAFEPSEICCKCGKNTYWTQDLNKNWWCKECAGFIPKELLDPYA